jgi:hypothetical protein
MDASQQVARMMHEISRNISSGRTLASVIDVHTRKEWFEPCEIDAVDLQVIDSEYQPIPLTEEWLLKFGAKELNAKRGVLKEFVLKTVRIELSDSGNFYYKNSKLILESAHQLQNLYFALTNKELTFKSE